MSKKKKLSAAAKRKAVKAAMALRAKHIKAAEKARALAEHVRADEIEKAAKIAREHEAAAAAAVPEPGFWERWFGK